MSLYAKYIKEREGKEVLENDYGFCSYSVTPDGIYVENLYVLPAFRKSGIAVDLENQVIEIIKQKGLKFLYSSVAINTPDCSANLARLIKHGARLHSANNNLIFCVKEV